MNRLITVALTLVLTAAGSAAASQVVEAVDGSDIPGVPLVGSSIVSEAGGAFVDRVYSLDVESGTSLLLTLRGEAGAELGLYVFDDEATSVVTDSPITSSALPGADQTLSMQFFAASRIYINVNGRNEDRAYVFQLGVSIVVDRSPPVIRTAIADTVGTGRSVCARVEAFDRISGVQSVAVSKVGSALPLEWRAYRGATTYCSDLDLPEGRHSLLVHARNTLQMVTTVQAGEIKIDNRAPIVTLDGPRSGVLLKPRGSLGFTFSEAVWFVGARRSGVVVTTQTGELLRGTVEIAEDRRSVKWTPVAAVPVGTMVVGMLAQVRDAAGNITTPLEPHIVTRKQRTSLSLTIERRTSRRIYLRVRGSSNLDGESGAVEVRSGRSWVPLRTLVLAADGASFSVLRAEWRQARIVWQGSELLHVSNAESPIFN
jgi:hypothetical protein